VRGGYCSCDVLHECGDGIPPDFIIFKEGIMKKISLLFLLVVCVSVPAFSAGKMTFSVMDLEARGVPESDAEKISHIIRTELSNVREFQVLDRNKAAVCGDIACAVQAGKQMGAQKVFIGTLMKIGEQMTVTCRVIDVEKGTVDFAGNEKAVSQSDELYMAERLCEKLVRKMTGKELYGGNDNPGDSNPAKKHGSSAYSSYNPAKDPTGWLALGSGITCALGFAFSYYSYEWRTAYSFEDSFNDVFILMYYPYMSQSTIDYLTINEYIERKNRKHRAEDIRTRNYYISAGFGCFSVIMLVTFIGRNIAHAASADKDAKVGDVSLVMPSLYSGPAGSREGEQFNMGVGLSMKF
jgi:TolB-like protein